MRAVCVDTPGGTENLQLKHVPRPQPKGGEVLVKVHATAMNRADLLQVLKLYNNNNNNIFSVEITQLVGIYDYF